MFQFRRVSMRNFQSVGQVTQTVDLQAPGLTLVLGHNADAGAGDARNGVGKTTLAQAIAFGLYGAPLANIRLDGLVNNVNSRNMLVTLEFSRDGVDYRIERGRKPNLLRFFKADRLAASEANDAQGENRQTQAQIDRLVGMSASLFGHLVATSAEDTPFLRLKAAEQREVIEELLGIALLSQRDEALKPRIAETRDLIRAEEAALAAQDAANKRIAQAIERATAQQSAWRVAQNSKLALLDADLAEIAAVDFEAELAAFDRLDAWTAAGRDLQSLRAQHAAAAQALAKEAEACASEARRLRTATGTGDNAAARLRTDAARRLAEAARHEADLPAKAAALDVIRQAIAQPDQHRCSVCGQGLSGTDHLHAVMRALGSEAAAAENAVASRRDEAARLRGEAEDIGREIAAAERREAEGRKEAEALLAAAEARLEDNRRAASEHATGGALLDRAAGELGPQPRTAFRNREQVWALREARNALDAERAREAMAENPHDAHVASLAATLLPLDDAALQAALATQKHQDFLHRLLSGKDSFVRKRIVDRNLGLLNQHLAAFLARLGLPHEVRFLPDLSLDIAMLGRPFDFEQLSRGQKSRVTVALTWAFRDVWEAVNHRINLLLVDELVDSGMDNSGAEAAFAALREMAGASGGADARIAAPRSVLLISHKDALIGRADRILHVHLENQFTRFSSEAA